MTKKYTICRIPTGCMTTVLPGPVIKGSVLMSSTSSSLTTCAVPSARYTKSCFTSIGPGAAVTTATRRTAVMGGTRDGYRNRTAGGRMACTPLFGSVSKLAETLLRPEKKNDRIRAIITKDISNLALMVKYFFIKWVKPKT